MASIVAPQVTTAGNQNEAVTVVYTDEYDIYARLPEWGYTHRTVCHADEEFAQDCVDDDRAVDSIETSWQWSPSPIKASPRPIQKCASLCWPMDDWHFDGHQPM